MDGYEFGVRDVMKMIGSYPNATFSTKFKDEVYSLIEKKVLYLLEKYHSDFIESSSFRKRNKYKTFEEMKEIWKKENLNISNNGAIG